MTIVPSFEIGSVTNSPNMYFAKTFSEAKGRKLNLERHNSKKLPLTISITLVLFINPSVLLATHLYKYTTPLVNLLFHIPSAFVLKRAVSFSNSWYKLTAGLA